MRDLGTTLAALFELGVEYGLIDYVLKVSALEVGNKYGQIYAAHAAYLRKLYRRYAGHQC